MLDSIEAGDFGEMCLHRKIAPYQCSVFSISNGMMEYSSQFYLFLPIKCHLKFISFIDASTSQDLSDLLKYISMLLERSQISVLNLDDCQLSDSTALDQKHREMDAIGVPYSLVIDSESLRTGFMKLRNRDTTLSETIHISYLKDYLPQIFQSKN